MPPSLEKRHGKVVYKHSQVPDRAWTTSEGRSAQLGRGDGGIVSKAPRHI